MMHPVAQTILQQLGGNRFLAMTGAKDLMSSPHGLSFKIKGKAPGSGRPITHVRITLNTNDLYIVEARRWSASSLTMFTVSRTTDVWADMLGEVFTDATGLYTRL